jgi:aerobic-type carbon monoxide dehydrogenase small subunit (CoxS/CutS family)
MTGPTGDAVVDISITVNGAVQRLRAVPADLTLLELLQEELALTGTKFGCGIGVCLACTVAVRGAAGAPLEAVCACQTLAVSLDGKEVTTVEGVAPRQAGEAGGAGQLSPLQQALLDAFAFQCGYCTPGFVMAAFVLLDRLRRNPAKTERELDVEIERACGAHVCRCTGYRRYHEAIRRVAMAQAFFAREAGFTRE